MANKKSKMQAMKARSAVPPRTLEEATSEEADPAGVLAEGIEEVDSVDVLPEVTDEADPVGALAEADPSGVLANAEQAATPPRAPDEAADEHTAEGDNALVQESAEPADVAPGALPLPRRLHKLSVPELQALYKQVIQRETGSTSKTYLATMIRNARKGYVRIGPRTTREKKGPMVHLPLRMAKDDVPVLDEVWERHGLVSRSELFRRALHKELVAMGEETAAALFAEPEEA